MLKKHILQTALHNNFLLLPNIHRRSLYHSHALACIMFEVYSMDSQFRLMLVISPVLFEQQHLRS